MVAKAYGFTVPPTGKNLISQTVNLLIGASMKTHDRKKFKAKSGSFKKKAISAEGVKFSR
jgi:hypothetical protein